MLIPGSGMQLTNIAHARDLSSMLTLAVESPGGAAGRIFNCVCDRAVTFDGLAKLCAAAAGATVEIVHYDPATVGVDAKKAFPFRNMVIFQAFHTNHMHHRALPKIKAPVGIAVLPRDISDNYDFSR